MLAKIQERTNAPTQDLQIIFVEQRPTPAINVVTQSGATTEVQTKEQQPDEAWVRKAPAKVPAFDIEREKEIFMEAKRDFAAPNTSVIPAQQLQQQSQPQEASTDKVSTLSSFLQSCLKLL